MTLGTRFGAFAPRLLPLVAGTRAASLPQAGVSRSGWVTVALSRDSSESCS